MVGVTAARVCGVAARAAMTSAGGVIDPDRRNMYSASTTPMTNTITIMYYNYVTRKTKTYVCIYRYLEHGLTMEYVIHCLKNVPEDDIRYRSCPPISGKYILC
jgi:hypothetical protein